MKEMTIGLMVQDEGEEGDGEGEGEEDLVNFLSLLSILSIGKC